MNTKGTKRGVEMQGKDRPIWCPTALFAEGKENQWYIDSRCSKQMTGDKDKLLSYKALEK